jgi:hypothetical protein
MGTSDAYDCNRRSRRRDENKRRRVEVAVERLRLPPEAGQALSAGIYGLYRNLVAQKSVDDQDRYFRQRQSRAEHKLAERTAIASGADTDPSPYVADMREFTARFANGHSPRVIAKQLNAEGVAGPNRRAWGDTTIRGHAERGTVSSTTLSISDD